VQASGDAVAGVAVLARRKVGVPSLDRGDRHDPREAVGEGLDALRAQPLELCAPGREEVRAARVGNALRGLLGVGHGR